MRDHVICYCGEKLSLAQIAKRTGISEGYASQFARDYGIPVRGQKDYDASQHPVLTRDWLTDRYVTLSRSLRSIAAEAGMSKSAVRRWVKIYRLPTPGTRFPIRMDIAAATADAPPVLRLAITGPGAWKRLGRLAAASSYPSLRQAAASLDIEHSVLISQVNRLEREFGHRLLDRRPASRRCSRPPTVRRSSPPYAQPAPPGPLATSARAAQGKCRKTETQLSFRSVRFPANEQVALAGHAIRTETLHA
jgi:transcriptional regulator with XRE-family HTH domain